MARKDDLTQELPGVPRRRGRPPTGSAKTAAERQRARRARLSADGVESLTVEVSAELANAIRAYVARQNADVAENPLTIGEAIERIVRDRLLRKR